MKPNTIARSLAIGNPADGFYALGSIRETNGSSEDVSDEEIVDAIKLLASAEGIFTETAGGSPWVWRRKLVEQGKIPKNESIVVCITGNGLKTQEAVAGKVGAAATINAKLSEFDEVAKNGF